MTIKIIIIKIIIIIMIIIINNNNNIYLKFWEFYNLLSPYIDFNFKHNPLILQLYNTNVK